MAPKIAIVYWSLYGHIQKLAEAEAEGIKKAGGNVDIYQLPETLSQEVLTKMHAPPKTDKYPVLEDPHKLTEYDAFLFGIPTRYGNFPAQWKIFWDKTGGLWQKGELWGKFAGLFIGTGTIGGGQESTAIAAMSTLTHHGIIYVPLGYKTAFPLLGDVSEVRGGSPWGAGTFSAGDGSRQPSAKELELATIQGESFYKSVSRVNWDENKVVKTDEGNNAVVETANESTTPAESTPQTANVDQSGQGNIHTGPQEGDEETKSKGPCGLPVKCVIL